MSTKESTHAQKSVRSPLAEASALQAAPGTQSTRKPAKVVTHGGVAPRGFPSSWKCEKQKFQSLVEEDCQRVAEIASVVTSYETHPLVLELGTPRKPLRYTPDLLLWFGDHGALCEVKPRSKLSSRKTATRAQERY